MIPSLMFPLLGLLALWEGGHCLVPDKLDQMSTAGSRYIDAELENAINGVRQMKTLMERTSKDHREILNSLEDTKRKKEDALLLAKETEQQLVEKTEVCNETMLALWEECKPCLKQTCMTFYTRTCHSGAGLVGRQLESFLNRSSPLSVWINGERVDSLMDVDEQQGQRLDDLEGRYALVEDGVDDLFRESTRAYEHLAPIFRFPFSGFWPQVQSVRLPLYGSRVARSISPFSSFYQSPFLPQQDFHHLFQPLSEATQRLFEGVQRVMGQNDRWLEGTQRPFLGRFPAGAPSPNNDRMVCREIRRNSAGCLQMREKCEKCREILKIDCSQTDPDQSRLRERFEDAVRLAERFTRRYDDLIKSYQEEMFNITSLLDQLNRQFGWVSRLANLTRNNDRPLRVTTVFQSSSNSSNPEDPSQAPATQVTVQLFDSEPLSLTVPGELSWDDPKFMELVVDQVLRRYKENEVE